MSTHAHTPPAEVGAASEPVPAPAASTGNGLAGRAEAGTGSASSDAAVYSVGVYASQAILFVAGVLHKGILGPVATGYWALIQSLWTFMTLAPLGASQGTTRQVPLRRGRGEMAESAALANSGCSFSILAMAVAGAILAVVAALFGGGWAPELRWGLMLLGIVAPLRTFSDCHDDIFAATKRFAPISVGLIAKAVVTLTAQTALVVLFGFYGMFAGLVLGIVAAQAVWYRMGLTSPRRPAFGWGLERERVVEVVRFGFPILVHVQVWLLLIAADSLLVAYLLGVKSLGSYALAVSVTGYIVQLPRSLGAALFPRMAERFGATNDLASIRHFIASGQQVLAYVLVPLAMGGAFYALPWVVRNLLPEFGPAIDVVAIMVGGSFCLALSTLPTKLLLTAGYRWGLTAIEAVAVAVSLGANWVAIQVFDWGLEGAAIGTSFSYLVLFLWLTWYALGKAYRRRVVARHIAQLLAVLVYVLAALWGIEELLGSGGDPVSDGLLALAKLTCFTAVMAPWMLLAERRHGTLSTITRLLRSGARKALTRS